MHFDMISVPSSSHYFPHGFILDSNRNDYTSIQFVKLPIIAGLWIHKSTVAHSAVSEVSQLIVVVIGVCVSTRSLIPLSKIPGILLEALEISEESFYDEVDGLAGRFTIIFGNPAHMKIVTDATGMRATFYAIPGAVVASHALLVEMALDGDLKKNDLPFATGFPGNGTPYPNTKLLTANTVYDCKTSTVLRIWPRRSIPSMTIDEAAQSIVCNTTLALRNLYAAMPLKLGLTAGLDSRLQLSLILHYGLPIETYTYGNLQTPLIDREVATHLAQRYGFGHTAVDTRSASQQLTMQLLNANYGTHHHTKVEPLQQHFKLNT